LEPDNQYKWAEIEVALPNGDRQRANALVGIDCEKGTVILDRPFSGREDPLFKEAFDLIKSILANSSERQSTNEPNPNFKNFLSLQMAYMLLWTAIERYVTIRYGLGNQVMKKILQMATEKNFLNSLKRHVKRNDKIYSTIAPDKIKKLNSEYPKSSLEYYYQVRCNITHWGKAAFDDFDRLKYSLTELTRVFEETLECAFHEAETPVS
jgi:hypothetical protein